MMDLSKMTLTDAVCIWIAAQRRAAQHAPALGGAMAAEQCAITMIARHADELTSFPSRCEPSPTAKDDGIIWHWLRSPDGREIIAKWISDGWLVPGRVAHISPVEMAKSNWMWDRPVIS